MNALKLLVEPSGEIVAIYSDAFADLCEAGRADIARASSVEPASGGWIATMNDGTKLGPFRLRETALAAEVDYLEQILGL